MKLTKTKLAKLKPCAEGFDWYKAKGETDLRKICDNLLADNKAHWANWLLVRLMTKKQKVRYAIYAAELVIDIFEKKYPSNKRPRNAINAAKAWLKNPNEKTKNAAYAAYAAADAAAYAAADAAAAYAAAAAAYAAADAAAAYAAYAAADAADAAAYAAAYAAADAADDAAAAYAADAAADAAAAYAADAAADAAAAYAAAAAAYAADAARKKLQAEIVEYGLKLLKS